MSTTQGDLKNELIASFPPGTEDFYDWEHPDGPGPLVEACAGVLHDHGTEMVEALRRELNPITADQKLQDWERLTGLQGTRAARSGNARARRLQVWSRLREKGPPTLSKIQRVVGPLLDYADPSKLVVIQADRTLLRAAHTYLSIGPVVPIGVSTPITFFVTDDAKVSKGGAQVDVALTHPDHSQIAANLTSPDGRSFGIASIGYGTGAAIPRLYFRGFEGAQVYGTWTLVIGSPVPGGTLTQAELFVEGVGRDAKGHDGRGAQIFDWAVIPDPALEGPNADREAAEQAIARINYATRRGFLAGPATAPELPLLIPDLDPRGIPDRNLPGP